ncbi:TPA: ZIP family metal transporter [Candidatus Woesearchaeota archaeon]|nr:ZIP family metal transporter [Candidatus Woesearchaeota archaeon]
MLLNIILATVAISLISLIGLAVSYKKVKKLLHYIISFAAGTLIAVAFFDLIPHSLEELEVAGFHIEESIIFVALGIVLFFLIERWIHWHHCDKHDCSKRSAGILILVGDFVHNFIDGILIAGAFMLDFTTGLFTTLTVAIHEIPQEFGDFAVLLHAGYKKKKALLYNFISALSAVIGGVLGFAMFTQVDGIAPFAVLITAGGFLYIALSDIVPEMHQHEKDRKMLILETLIFIVTIIGFYFFLGAMHGHA